LWFRSRSGLEESTPEILQRLKARQHRPESQGCDDRKSQDGAQAGERA
jgi:hypothetical protein